MRHPESPLLFALACLLTTAHAETVSLEPVRDNTLFVSATGGLSSGSGPAIFVGMNSGGLVRRALLAFDVADALPAGAVVDSVSLRLTVSNVSNSNPTAIDVRRVLADWGEGDSISGGGSGAPAESSDATWLHTFFPDSLWDTPGGDFDATVRATATVTGLDTYVWSSSSLVADVQSWLDDPATNFGWIVTGDEATPSSAKRVDSREVLDPGTRPEIVVEFHDDTSAVRARTWGRTKSLFRSSPD